AVAASSTASWPALLAAGGTLMIRGSREPSSTAGGELVNGRHLLGRGEGIQFSHDGRQLARQGGKVTGRRASLDRRRQHLSERLGARPTVPRCCRLGQASMRLGHGLYAFLTAYRTTQRQSPHPGLETPSEGRTGPARRETGPGFPPWGEKGR